MALYAHQMEVAIPVEEQRSALSVAPGDEEEMGGSNRDSIGRWFRELQHYGFIVMTNPGGLGVDGKVGRRIGD